MDDEVFDKSVHSHIFSTSKAPHKNPLTPMRRKKAQAKKTSSKVFQMASTSTIQGGLEEAFTPRDSKRTPTASPPLVDLQVFVDIYIPPTMGFFS